MKDFEGAVSAESLGESTTTYHLILFMFCKGHFDASCYLCIMICRFDNLPGAKFGIYGSFLPAHRRSPVWSQSKSPPRVQNFIAQSPNTIQTEVPFLYYCVTFSANIWWIIINNLLL